MKKNIKYNYNENYYFITSDIIDLLINKINLNNKEILNHLNYGKVIDIHITDNISYDFSVLNSKNEELSKYFHIEEENIFKSVEEFKKYFYIIRKKQLKILISNLRNELKNYKNE